MGLGIDFGTTRTVVAFSDRGNFPVVSFETHLGDSVEWFPSMVAERNGELLFGLDAHAVAGDPTYAHLRSFKRLLSGKSASATSEVTIGSTTLRTTEVLDRFVLALKDALLSRSNFATHASKKKTKVSLDELDAVIATPANAFCTQRFATLEAFRRAGFIVRSMLNEPSAAGFEFSHRHARSLSSKREHVIVYDLGGGTFDASLVHVTGTHHDVVATAGLASLGGDDFDDALADLVAKEASFDRAGLTPHRSQRLLDACRDAKEGLNASSRRITVELQDVIDGGTSSTIATNEFYDAVTPLVERTIEAMQPLVHREALVEGAGSGETAERSDEGEEPKGIELEGIAGIYIVGGASSLPIVGRILRSRYGKRVHRSPYPHAAVAIGLAIATDNAGAFELDDRFSRNFGVFREAASGARASYDPIFTREMPLPRPGTPSLVVSRRYRAAHDVGHYRFFECADLDSAGEPRGDLAPLSDLYFPFEPQLRNEPALEKRQVHRLRGAGPLIEERYAMDARGLIEITIVDLETGFERKKTLGAA